MPSSRQNTRGLSDRHETFLADLIDGRITPGSGNQSANQLDVRNDHRRQNWAFALDGKSTRAASISVKLADWDKVVDQCHDEQPGMALRFYTDGTLRRSVDLIVVQARDFGAMLDELRRT